MRDELSLSDARRRCQSILVEAGHLLESPHLAGAEQTLVRLRLARDELATKVMKVESVAVAERMASQQLSDAVDRLLQEILTTRRLMAGRIGPHGEPSE